MTDGRLLFHGKAGEVRLIDITVSLSQMIAVGSSAGGRTWWPQRKVRGLLLPQSCVISRKLEPRPRNRAFSCFNPESQKTNLGVTDSEYSGPVGEKPELLRRD